MTDEIKLPIGIKRGPYCNEGYFLSKEQSKIILEELRSYLDLMESDYPQSYIDKWSTGVKKAIAILTGDAND